MMEKDPFAVLGLPYGAPTADVKKRYKEMANYYHPDKNPGDQRAADIMKNVNEAYNAIKSHDYYSEQHYYPERMMSAPKEKQPEYSSAPQQNNSQNYTPNYGGGAQTATEEARQGGMPNGFYDSQGKYHYMDPNQGASQAEQEKAWNDAVYQDQKNREEKLRKKQIARNLISRIGPVVLGAIVLIIAISLLHSHSVQKGINKAVNQPETRQALSIQIPEIPTAYVPGILI